jgi:hypothetical protein
MKGCLVEITSLGKPDGLRPVGCFRRLRATRGLRYARRPVVAAVIAGAVVLGGTAACSSPGTPATPAGASASASGNVLAGLTADQTVRRAAANLKTISSVHVAGSVTHSGQRISLNLTLGTRGCTGTLGMKGQGSVQMLKIGKKLWIKPDDQFWKNAAGSSFDPAVLQRVSGKYIEPSNKDSVMKKIGPFCTPSTFARAFDGQVTGTVKGPATTISGQPALQIIDTGDSASAYVTISAHPQFLRLDAGGTGRLDFTRHGAPMHLTPLSASETLNGAKYGF